MSETVDSGVFYIGQIPMSWSCTRIGHVCEKLERSCEMADPTLICSNQGNVVYREGKSMGQTSDKLSAFQGVQEGDLLIHGMDTWHGAVAVSSLKGKCSGVVHVCESSQNKRFLAYYLRTHAFHGVYKAITNGVRGNTSDLRSWAKARTLYIAFPSLQLQGKIADYLDRKSAAIDELVSRRQQMIEKLRELKKSIIAQAVTKGIRPNRPLKDSGVPWIGKIPDEWRVVPSRHLFRESKKTRIEGDEMLAATQKFGVIPQSEYMKRIGARIVSASKDLDKWKHVDAGDFVISLRSFQGGLELCTIRGCVTWHYIVLKQNMGPLDRSFFKWLFKSRPYIRALQMTSDYIRDGQDLRYSNFKKVPLMLPLIAEQQEIADYLDKKCAEIDEMIARHTGIIEKLKELKVSLIANVVTGKVDVRPQPNS